MQPVILLDHQIQIGSEHARQALVFEVKKEQAFAVHTLPQPVPQDLP